MDLSSGKLIRFDTLPIHSGYEKYPEKSVAIPRKKVNYDEDLLGKDFFRKDVKPLQIISPEGPSFSVTGNEISWQKFKFRIR